jgi:GAF domain-containing protein
MLRRGVTRPPVKGQRAKKHRAAGKAPAAHSSVDPTQEQLAERLTRERDEALEQQAAAADVLKVISRSAFDLQKVFDALTESACQVCGAYDATLLLREAESLRIHSHHGPISIDYDKVPISRDWATGRSVVDRKSVHVHDLRSEELEFPIGSDMARRMDVRTMLAVPLIREQEVIGSLGLRRTEVHPFTDKQIALAETFADQAVIAIENSRLLSELRESLQQQTATADVLKVISRSTLDLQKVLDSLVESATRLCEAQDAFIFLPSGDVYRAAAQYGYSPEYHEFVESNPPTIDRGSVVGRTVIDKQPVHISDVLADPDYTRYDAQRIGGYRAVLGVPLLREGNVVGVIFLSRAKPQPFTEKQIELVRTFADQAVIAIENVRLFEQVQAKTRDLEETLHQQTATSEVLQIISSSPGDLAPVFDKMLENATHVCGANFGLMNLYDEEGSFRPVAQYNVPSAYAAWLAQTPFQPHPQSGLGTVARTHQVVHIEDIRTLPPYLDSNPSVVKLADLAGARTYFVVPMLKEDDLIGAITIFRQEVRPFTDKQIEMVNNFAKQAVIAIENTRLLKELRQSLQQQTATADVLKVISRSSVELETVLDTLVDTVTRLCRADQATLFHQRGDMLHLIASRGWSEQAKAFVRTYPLAADRGSRSAFFPLVAHASNPSQVKRSSW